MKDLLGYIAQKAKCAYISDLPALYKSVIKAQHIQGIGKDDFTLKQWNDAVNYILKTRHKFATVEEARDFFINALK